MRADPWRALRGIFVLALLAALPAAARAQVSPGPLARAHAALEGNRSCFQCHPPAGSSAKMDDRCLTCHREIATMIEARRGLHARLTGKACARCHPDHGGADFELVVFDEGAPEKFDHARAGFALEGAHARVACRSCHQPKNQAAAIAALMKRKDHAQSWLGMETACVSCHGDPHRAQLGTRCESCHTLTAWSPPSRFDHARTDYPLTGRHTTLACAKCHIGADVPKQSAAATWKPLAHGECSSCHKDPHAGRFGGKCASCHETDDFHHLRTASFDHSRTRYPLLGAHASVTCAKCHDPATAFGAKPAFDRCDRCHRDAHGGQLAVKSGPARDCAECHVVADFTASTFTLAAHQQTNYPLQGAHARAACAKCHARSDATGAPASYGTARVPLHPAAADCATCHADPHGGRFSAGGARPRSEGCTACHGMERFAPSRVDVAAHARYPFALTGAHRAVPCAACHKELARTAASGAGTLKGAKLAAVEFRDERRRCADCHTSPHGTQFASRREKGACEGCHVDAAFAPASKFDHARDAAFKLEGAHARIACAACHPTQKTPDGPRVVYRPLSSRCESCHATN